MVTKLKDKVLTLTYAMLLPFIIFWSFRLGEILSLSLFDEMGDQVISSAFILSPDNHYWYFASIVIGSLFSSVWVLGLFFGALTGREKLVIKHVSE